MRPIRMTGQKLLEHVEADVASPRRPLRRTCAPMLCQGVSRVRAGEQLEFPPHVAFPTQLYSSKPRFATAHA